MTLHQFLFDRLWEWGVRYIFGIPGDFALNLFEALERDARFGLIRLSHEPAVGFAADGAARMTGGLGVCCVTYGAGGLNMVNPVACAYAEQSPLVVLSGNDTVAWPFARLATLWGGNGFNAATVGELRRALAEGWASPRFSIVEVPVAKGDISPVLARFVQAFKDRVYRQPVPQSG